MRSHLRSMAKRKVSDFLLREEGMVGNRTAFSAAALVSATALAMTLFVVADADAGTCGGRECNLRNCCTADGGERYWCTNANPPRPWHCWRA